MVFSEVSPLLEMFTVEMCSVARVPLCSDSYTAYANVPPEAGDPTLVELVQISLTAVRVTWSPPSDGASVTGYTVHYTGDDSRAERISGLPPSTTSTDITGLTSGRTYTISVEATTGNGLSVESEERTITLREQN